MSDWLASVLQNAAEGERLAEACRTNPTKENHVLHSVHVWRQGCVHGAAGECDECNNLFFLVLANNLGLSLPFPPVADVASTRQLRRRKAP